MTTRPIQDVINELKKNGWEAIQVRIKRVQSNYAARELLLEKDIELHLENQEQYPYLMVTKDQLPAVRRALGRMHLTGKSVQDSKKRVLEISMVANDFPYLTISYLTRLSRKSTRCRIVRTYQRGYRTKRLVCDA